jgi:KaiC/GvpD/RAD55 family RecA-like ATPase
MVISELVKRSPLRIFENSIHGGLGKGNIGMLVSPKGVGKTACLVHIATDKLFREKHVIHVSFSSRVDHIISWYEDIFREIAKKRDLESAVDVHDEIIKNRVIMNFNQHGIRMEQILKSITAMIHDGHFAADSIIFDGYDIAHAGIEDMTLLREFAENISVEVWLSVSVPEDTDIEAYVAPYDGVSSVVITLESVGDHVHFKALKDRDIREPIDMHLKLDPKTLLIAEEE